MRTLKSRCLPPGWDNINNNLDNLLTNLIKAKNTISDFLRIGNVRTRNISLAIKRLENKASENLTNGAEKNVSEGKNAARLDARCFDSATQKQSLVSWKGLS